MNKPSNFTFENVRFSPVAFDGRRAIIIDMGDSADVVFFRGSLPSAWFAMNTGRWYMGDVVVAVTPSGRRHVVAVNA